MKSKIKGLRLFGLALVLAIFALLLRPAAYAASAGVYMTEVTPHYRNPLTGEIEDQGGEAAEAIGEGMVKSCVDTDGLVEIDAEGNTYTTVRLKRASALNNISFSTSTGGGFSSADSTVTNSFGDNVDYRITMPEEGAVIRCEMHVIPMDRDVVFFVSTSGLSEGQGDFVSMIDTSAPEEKAEPKQEETEKPQASASERETAAADRSEASSTAQTSSAPVKNPAKTSTKAAESSSKPQAEASQRASTEDESQSRVESLSLIHI